VNDEPIALPRPRRAALRYEPGFAAACRALRAAMDDASAGERSAA
jgi:hypothetical protein